MKTRHITRGIGLLALAALAGCAGGKVDEKSQDSAAADSTTVQSTVAAQAPAFLGRPGKAVATMTTAGYTYVQVETDKGTYWAAAPQFEVKQGDQVQVDAGLPMSNYHSTSLNRDFDMVYFASSVTVNGEPTAPEAGAAPAAGGQPAALPAGHPPLGEHAATVDLGGIKKAEDGNTVAELFAGRKDFAGKAVTVRGRVVKINTGIMGRNWIHVRDGSGAEGTNDLTVTTDAGAKVGDTVLVTGTAAVDKDFGAGYKYDLIVENAKVTVE